MKLEINKDWFETMAAKEGDLEISAGRPREFPAYGGCRCMCHRRDLMHCMPCCHPDDDAPELRWLCQEIELRKLSRSPRPTEGHWMQFVDRRRPPPMQPDLSPITKFRA